MLTSPRTVNGRDLWRSAVIILGCLLVGGCSDGKGQLKTYPAQGKATFQGKPMQRAMITLYPIKGEAKTNHLLPRGIVGEDGSYTVGTYRVGDGAPAGRYKVTIVWIEDFDSPMVRPDQPADRLQGRYANRDKSSIEVTITEGDNTLRPIELP